MEDLMISLERARQEMPDPFLMKTEIEQFYNSPAAKELIGSGQSAVDRILTYIGAQPEPSLVVPAVLLLSYFEPDTFYAFLLNILKRADRPVVEAFEHGFWLIKKDEEQLTADLIAIAEQNPNVLLLLQRPAVGKHKADLRKWIEKKTMPLSLYTMYCYQYALTKEDVSFLTEVSGWIELPEIKSLAEQYLQMLAKTDE